MQTSMPTVNAFRLFSMLSFRFDESAVAEEF